MQQRKEERNHFSFPWHKQCSLKWNFLCVL
jgi:hypothetical protein